MAASAARPESRKAWSAPGIRSQLVSYNYQWWVDNRDMVVDRFNKWLLG